MKALSVKQPWLHLIESKAKTIETRTWKTEYRGDILLCSSLQPAKNMMDLIQVIQEECDFDAETFYGHARCIVEIYDIKPMIEAHEDDAMCLLYPGAYSWFLKNIRPVEPFIVKGQLGLFEIRMEYNLTYN